MQPAGECWRLSPLDPQPLLLALGRHGQEGNIRRIDEGILGLLEQGIDCRD